MAKKEVIKMTKKALERFLEGKKKKRKRLKDDEKGDYALSKQGGSLTTGTMPSGKLPPEFLDKGAFKKGGAVKKKAKKKKARTGMKVRGTKFKGIF